MDKSVTSYYNNLVIIRSGSDLNEKGFSWLDKIFG